MVITLCFLVFLFGFFWEESFEREIVPQKDDIHFFNEKGKIEFEGIISQEPKKGKRSNQLIINTEKVVINQDFYSVKGKVLTILPLGSSYPYGAKVRILGELKTPRNYKKELSDFDYKEYLRKDRIYSIIYYPEIELISLGQGNKFYEMIFSLKEKFKKTAEILLFPEGAILAAMVLGDKSRISQDLEEKFSLSGLSHVVAISGLHIIILFEIFLFIFLAFGLWRSQATILSLFLVIFYIFLVGAPFSAIRAGIMGGILYLGYSLGRLNSSARALIFAATSMVFFNPLILTRDIGFQLSFLASLGIIYLFPIFKKWYQRSKIKELIFLTLSAQIFCLPILVFNFGKFPIFSPISNLLVVPLSSYLLAFGLGFLIIGTLFPFLAVFLSFLIWPFFHWMIWVANKTASSFTIEISGIFILIFYSLLGFFIFWFYKNKQKRII